MTPPNDEYLALVCLAMFPKVAASTYPEVAAEEDAGPPIKILTFLFGEVFLAQLSQSPKFQA